MAHTIQVPLFCAGTVRKGAQARQARRRLTRIADTGYTVTTCGGWLWRWRLVAARLRAWCAVALIAAWVVRGLGRAFLYLCWVPASEMDTAKKDLAAVLRPCDAARAFACTMSAASDPLALGASRCTLRRLALVVRPHLAPPRGCVSVHLWHSRVGGTLLPPILHTPLSSALVPPGTCLPGLACRVHGLEDEDQKHAKAEEDERVHGRRWPGSRLPLAGCV